MGTKTFRINEKNAPYLFMGPGLLLFLVFSAYPMIISFVYSFQNKIGTQKITFAGLDNYVKAFTDPIFMKSLYNILIIFVMHAPLMIFLSLLLAHMLNSKTTLFRNVFRISFFVPNITNAVAYTIIFKLLLSNDGVINSVLSVFGVTPLLWTGDPMLAKWTISIMTIWRWMGYNMVIFLAAMQSISDELYEAADIDGASKIEQFFKITIPMMKNPIFFTTIMTVSGTLGLFAEAQLLAQGGPNYGTYTPALMIYNVAWKQFNFGYASAISYIISIITILIAYAQFKLGKEKK